MPNVGFGGVVKRWKKMSERERKAKMSPLMRMSYAQFKRWRKDN